MARVRAGGPPKKERTPVEPRAVAKALADRPKGIDSASLLSSLIEEWGGTREFARAIKEQYDDATDSPMTRAKILEMVNRLVVVVTTQELAKPRRAEDMDDDELGFAAAALMRRFNGNATPPTPGA